MSRIIAAAAIRGAHQIAQQAQDILEKAVREKGEDAAVEFPNTGYFIPIIYGMTGHEVKTLADFRPVMQRIRDLLPPLVGDRVWLPYLGPALDAGMATLFAEEIIEACKYVIGPSPVHDIWLGAADDVILRERGIEFVDGTAPGLPPSSARRPTPRRPSASPANSRNGASTFLCAPTTTARRSRSNSRRPASRWGGKRGWCRSAPGLRRRFTRWALPRARP